MTTDLGGGGAEAAEAGGGNALAAARMSMRKINPLVEQPARAPNKKAHELIYAPAMSATKRINKMHSDLQRLLLLLQHKEAAKRANHAQRRAARENEIKRG